MTSTDPLLAALIAKLPPGGSTWSAKKRAAWLHMLWMAFDVVYELEDGEVVEVPAFLTSAPVKAVQPDAPPATPAPAQPLEQAKAPYPFVIDLEGLARRGNGDRVMPGVVNDTLFDLRGEGDLSSIVWADGSRGVRGLTLDISPAA